MKQKIIYCSVALAAVFFITNSCTKKETETTAIENPEVVLPASDSLIQSDAAILSDDSAKVKTAVGVQDEEQNAMNKENADAEKLKEAKEEKK